MEQKDGAAFARIVARTERVEYEELGLKARNAQLEHIA